MIRTTPLEARNEEYEEPLRLAGYVRRPPLIVARLQAHYYATLQRWWERTAAVERAAIGYHSYTVC